MPSGPGFKMVNLTRFCSSRTSRFHIQMFNSHLRTPKADITSEAYRCTIISMGFNHKWKDAMDDPMHKKWMHLTPLVGKAFSKNDNVSSIIC